ncbi:hypothetical protein CBR_g10775 [Chara braunii]|uniref:Uncharacterized protein n=1 Tax=Chara braunii TaxID=69332 RepID=A0A388KP56_CHABU|nr:hypothetical protein CBR_g10775 [Chara braunii]|eukprot:GBG71836.1 hypothetical protein CBR_g10775 [Chara braunii]
MHSIFSTPETMSPKTHMRLAEPFPPCAKSMRHFKGVTSIHGATEEDFKEDPWMTVVPCMDGHLDGWHDVNWAAMESRCPWARHYKFANMLEFGDLITRSDAVLGYKFLSRMLRTLSCISRHFSRLECHYAALRFVELREEATAVQSAGIRSSPFANCWRCCLFSNASSATSGADTMLTSRGEEQPTGTLGRESMDTKSWSHHAHTKWFVDWCFAEDDEPMKPPCGPVIFVEDRKGRRLLGSVKGCQPSKKHDKQCYLMHVVYNSKGDILAGAKGAILSWDLFQGFGGGALRTPFYTKVAEGGLVSAKEFFDEVEKSEFDLDDPCQISSDLELLLLVQMCSGFVSSGSVQPQHGEERGRFDGSEEEEEEDTRVSPHRLGDRGTLRIPGSERGATVVEQPSTSSGGRALGSEDRTVGVVFGGEGGEQQSTQKRRGGFEGEASGAKKKQKTKTSQQLGGERKGAEGHVGASSQKRPASALKPPQSAPVQPRGVIDIDAAYFLEWKNGMRTKWEFSINTSQVIDIGEWEAAYNQRSLDLVQIQAIIDTMTMTYSQTKKTYELPTLKLAPLGLVKPTSGVRADRLKSEDWKDELAGLLLRWKSAWETGMEFFERSETGRLLALEGAKWIAKKKKVQGLKPGVSHIENEKDGQKVVVYNVPVEAPQKKGKKEQEPGNWFVQVTEPDPHCWKSMEALTDNEKCRLLKKVLNCEVVWVQTGSSALAKQGKLGMKLVIDSSLFKDCPPYMGCEDDKSIKATKKLVQNKKLPIDWKNKVLFMLTGSRSKSMEVALAEGMVHILWNDSKDVTTIAPFGVDPLDAQMKVTELERAVGITRCDTCVLDLCEPVDIKQWTAKVFESLNALLEHLFPSHWTVVAFVPREHDYYFMTSLHHLSVVKAMVGKWVRRTRQKKSFGVGHNLYSLDDRMYILFKGDDLRENTSVVYDARLAAGDAAAVGALQKVTPTETSDMSFDASEWPVVIHGRDPVVYKGHGRNPTQFAHLLEFLCKKGDDIMFLGKAHAQVVWEVLKAYRCEFITKSEKPRRVWDPSTDMWFKLSARKRSRIYEFLFLEKRPARGTDIEYMRRKEHMLALLDNYHGATRLNAKNFLDRLELLYFVESEPVLRLESYGALIDADEESLTGVDTGAPEEDSDTKEIDIDYRLAPVLPSPASSLAKNSNLQPADPAIIATADRLFRELHDKQWLELSDNFYDLKTSPSKKKVNWKVPPLTGTQGSVGGGPPSPSGAGGGGGNGHEEGGGGGSGRTTSGGSAPTSSSGTGGQGRIAHSGVGDGGVNVTHSPTAGSGKSGKFARIRISQTEEPVPVEAAKSASIRTSTTLEQAALPSWTALGSFGEVGRGHVQGSLRREGQVRGHPYQGGRRSGECTGPVELYRSTGVEDGRRLGCEGDIDDDMTAMEMETQVVSGLSVDHEEYDAHHLATAVHPPDGCNKAIMTVSPAKTTRRLSVNEVIDSIMGDEQVQTLSSTPSKDDALVSNETFAARDLALIQSCFPVPWSPLTGGRGAGVGGRQHVTFPKKCRVGTPALDVLALPAPTSPTKEQKEKQAGKH